MSNETHKPIARGFSVEVTKHRVRLPNGREMELDIVQHPGASAVVPFVSASEVLLIRQYRHATGASILEVPAGKIDAGESPETTAARELEEEIGRRPGRLEKLGWVWTSPGFTDEKIHLYAAFDLERSVARPEDDEIIEVIPTPLSEALELVWRGELTDAKSAMALIHAARHVGLLP